MSIRKKLLTETELRRFLKLANLGAVGNQRLSEMGYDMPGARDEDEELEAELHATEDELGDEDREADLEGDELDNMELDAGPVEGGEEDVLMSLLGAIQNWAEEAGIDMDLEGGEDEGAMDDMDMEPEVAAMEPLAMDDEEEEVVDMEVEEEPMMEEETDLEEDKKAAMDHMVAEVAKKVAARLQVETRREDLVDQLAERILQRFTKK